MEPIRTWAVSCSIRLAVAASILAVVLAGVSPAQPAGAPAPPDASSAQRAAPAPRAGAVLPDGACVSERLFGLPGLANVGRVAPGIFRGAQPRPEGYATLKAMGIRTVINLRSRHGEAEAVEAAGMRPVEIRMSTFEDVDLERVRKAVTLMADPANHPVFVHCAHGQDRTGVVVAVYRMDVEGWAAAAAEDEMQAFGFNDIWVQLKDFVRHYAAKPAR